MNSAIPPQKTIVIPGKWMVVGMFAFGIATTTTLWVYWTLHTAPYRPLREAILAEYPQTAPRVDGGQRKKHQETPKLLRVVMKLDFDPNLEERAADVESIVARVTQLAIEHARLHDFEQLEVHFFWPEKEKVLHQRTITRNVADMDEATTDDPTKVESRSP